MSAFTRPVLWHISANRSHWPNTKAEEEGNGKDVSAMEIKTEPDDVMCLWP